MEGANVQVKSGGERTKNRLHLHRDNKTNARLS